MSASPDPPAPDTDADEAFDELLAQVARSPHAGLLPPGASVGEYRIVKFLGSGAFGTVYHATHAVIGKQVALKVLSSQLAGDPSAAARFVDEARAVNRIAHPNIVDIFGFGSLADGRKYCVMELLNGETLGAFLKRCAPLPVAEAVPILLRIAAGLDAAHENAIVHRDLKPDNIFLCRPQASESGSASLEPKVKLLDFGIAQIADGLHQKTGSQLRLGTPAYMSPEQCEGAHVDHRSDIYALGLVAFEMLTGHAAFQGSTALQVAFKQVSVSAPPPSSHAPKLSKRVDDAVLRMLSKRPEDRPSSATAAILALTEVAGEPGGTSSGAAGKSSLRRGSAGVGLAMVGLCAVAWVLTQRACSPRLAPETARAVPPVEGSAVAPPSDPPARLEAQVPPAASVRIRIEGAPTSAKVFEGKREVGRANSIIELPWSKSAVSLSVRGPSFGRELKLTPDHDQVVKIRPVTVAPRKNPELEY